MPSISRSRLDTKTCKSFVSSNVDEFSTSHFIVDWSLKCDKIDKMYAGVLIFFWEIFAIWPVGVPLMFIYVILSIRVLVRSKCITLLAEACRFLWGDYEESMILWEFLDIIRKISLTEFIIFVDTEEGLERIIRLYIGIVIYIIYTGVLALARPYKQMSDL